MMHLEEVVAQGEKPDSAAGMPRLLLAKFPAVTNKIMPESLSKEQAQALFGRL